MAYEFHLPDIGEGLTEATIIEWLVNVGDDVKLDEPLVEVETDKAVVEIPSPIAGVLLHRGAADGDTLEVGMILAVVGERGEQWEMVDQTREGDAPPRGVSADAAPIVGRLEEAPSAQPTVPTGTSGPQALPKVRKLAADLGIDLAAIAGSGPGGRITEADALAASDETSGATRRVPMSPLRRAAAQNLSRSWREIPHVTTYAEADAGAVLARRDALGRPPLETLLIEAILPVLVEFPDFNATVQADAIVHKLHYDIGFAVDTKEGLMVAVVRDAAGRSVEDIAAEVQRLSQAARDRTAVPAELRGQTFTVSNIGAVGGRYGTPIIPFGTTAILSVGRAEPRPKVHDGELAIGTEFPLSLSYDHRAIDGAKGRAFLAAVVARLEQSGES